MDLLRNTYLQIRSIRQILLVTLLGEEVESDVVELLNTALFHAARPTLGQPDPIKLGPLQICNLVSDLQN